MRTLSCRRPRHERGIVLLEVIIALTIFALVSLGLVTALTGCFDAEKDRDAADRAVRGLRNQFALLRGGPLLPGEQDVAMDANGLTYHVAIVPEPMQDQKQQPLIGMYRATITAQWKIEGKADQRQLSEILYQP
jgi:hypothetical protein